MWIVKDYVREGKLVPFCDNWRKLCESVGFVTLHEHHALLTEDRGTQMDMEGKPVHKSVKRISFFRRLAEKKGSPKIDYEVVWCMVKPE